MDLSRVFGDKALTINPATLQVNANATTVPQPNLQEAHALGESLRQQLGGMQGQVEKLHLHIQKMTQKIAETRRAYEQIIKERDEIRSRLVAAEGKLGEVHKVVQRYTHVQDPVVAADGFTYEHSVIQQYLDDCKQNSVAPISQLTKEELSDVLVPNQSLKKLVDLLKVVKPQAVPPSSAAALGQRPSHVVPSRTDGDSKVNGAANPPAQDGRLHPCVRVYGFCNYKDDCVYALCPYNACLSYLKGKCRFGSKCHELHVEFRGKLQGSGNIRSRAQQREKPVEGTMPVKSGTF